MAGTVQHLGSRPCHEKSPAVRVPWQQHTMVVVRIQNVDVEGFKAPTNSTPNAVPTAIVRNNEFIIATSKNPRECPAPRVIVKASVRVRGHETMQHDSDIDAR